MTPTPFKIDNGRLLFNGAVVHCPDSFNLQNDHQKQQVAKKCNQIYMAGFNDALKAIADHITQPGMQVPAPNGSRI